MVTTRFRILVADDEAALRDLTSRVLRRDGYEVVLAEDGLAAYNRIRQLDGDLDLVVTDVRMPKMSGTELAERLKVEYPNIQVVCISGYADSVSPSTRYFLQKPFDLRAFADTVREALKPRSDPPAD